MNQEIPRGTDNSKGTKKIIIKRSGTTMWAIAFITATLVGGFLIYYFFHVSEKTVDKIAEIPWKMVDGIASVAKPTIKITMVINSAISTFKKDAKLVVLTATIVVDVEKSSEKKILWDMLNLGKTTVRVRAPENKVQYYIPMSNISESSFYYDEGIKKITIIVPKPRLDEEIVEVQSDPEKIEVETDVGWGRLKAYSGNYLEVLAKKALRDEVIREGKHELLQDKAKTEAEKIIKEIFYKSAKPLAAWEISLEIQFEEK